MEPPGADASIVSGPPAIPAPVIVPDYKDRSTGLIVFGIVEILGGAMAALMIPLMLLGMVFARKTGGAAPPGNLAMAAGTYLLIAAALFVLGIGAIMARRWACALNLILSWISLIVGVLATVAICLLTPSSFMAGMRSAAERNPNGGNVSTGVMAAVLTFFIVMAAVFLILIPLAFLLFYRSRNVRETCRHRDPVERWTDRRPLPVIAVAILAAVGAFYCLIAGFAVPLFPFYGKYLTGWAGTAIFLALAVVNAYIAFSFLQLKVSGWWVATALVLVQAISSAVTFGRGNMIEAYSRMGWSQTQLQALQSNPFLRSGVFVCWQIGFAVAYLGFLIWLKRFFRPAQPPSYTGLQDAAPNSSQPGS